MLRNRIENIQKQTDDLMLIAETIKNLELRSQLEIIASEISFTIDVIEEEINKI
jgi:hypothetical protein